MKNTKKEIMFILGGNIFEEYSAYTLNFRRYINVAISKGYKCRIIVPISGKMKYFGVKIIQNNKNLIYYNIYSFHNFKNIFYVIIVFVLYLLIKPDVVVLSVANTFIHPFLYMLFKIKRPKKVIVYMHDPIPENWSARFSYNRFIRKIAYYFGLFIEKMDLYMSDIIIIPCMSLEKKILERNFVGKIKEFLLVFNTTGAVELLKSTKCINVTKRDLLNFSYKPVIIYPTMIQKNIRGIELLLSVLSKLKSKGFNPLLLIIGEGEKDWIVKLAQKYEVKENIILYSKISSEDLAKLYECSDFIILPPLEILLPTKFFESLVFGVIPIVWFKSEDVLLILEKVLSSNLTKQILYYNSDPEEISDVIEKLQRDKKSYRRIRELLQRKGETIIMEYHMIGEKSFKRSLNIERCV